MCFHCPADLAVEEEGVTIRVIRTAETEVAPSDATQDPQVLAEFRAGERFLVALQATAYVHNRPVVTESIHGIIESDRAGELKCAFEHDGAMHCLLMQVREKASATGHLRAGAWVLQ